MPGDRVMYRGREVTVLHSRSAAAATRARVEAWLARVVRPCGHDPADVREERAGIVCAYCGRPYHVR